MANFSLSSRAKFTPFTFDEMVKPFQMYKEYYTQQEQLASALAEQAAEWGQKLNEVTDHDTYQTYKNFESDLKDISERLVKQGLDPGLRANIQKMRHRYASEINPIKDAYNWRLQQIQQQIDGKSKGMVYEGDAATTSLSDYVANPNLVYGYADSKAGYTRLANAAEAIAQGLSEAKFSKNLDDYTKELLVRSGYDVSDVTTAIDKAMSDIQGVLSGTVSMDSSAGRIVQELLQNEYKASGISDWKNRNAQQEYLSKVSPALYNLIGKSAATSTEDYAKRAYLQDALIRGRQNSNNNTNNKNPRNPGRNKGGSNSVDYAYDRPDVYYSEGKVNRITHSDGNPNIGGNDIKDYTGLTVRRSKNNPYDIEIYHGGRLLASYNADPSNKSSHIKYYDRAKGKFVVKKNDEKLDDVLNDITAADIRHFARDIAENPGSENQYTYGVQDGKLFSIQNTARRVTTGINESADQLLEELYEAGYDIDQNSGDSSTGKPLDMWPQ